MAPPVHTEPFRLALVLVAAVVGGVVNSIAGGGTLLTFPALIGLGIPAIMANATSTVALWPGAVASMWGYSDLLTGMRSWVARLAVPSVSGGLVGAWLLLETPPSRFDAIVPWLVLGATVLFIAQKPMAVGATLGGYGGSRLAQRVPQARVRQAIIAIGLASAGWLLTRV